MAASSSLPDQLNSEGLAEAAQGRDGAAEIAFRRACALAPAHLGAIGNLANAETRRLLLSPALRHYGWALALVPEMPQLHLMLGAAEAHAGMAARATASLHRALVLMPAYAKAFINLGTFLSHGSRQAEGVRQFRRALACEPDSELAFAGCIQALSQDGRFEPILALLRRAAASHPASARLHAVAGEYFQTIGGLAAALRHLRRAVALDRRSARLHQQLLFALVLDPDTSNRSLFVEYRRWAHRHVPSAPPAVAAADRDPQRALKVGYLSADLYDHPVAYLIEGLIHRHDRSRVSPRLIATATRSDATSRRLFASADGWRSVAALSDADAARVIADMGVDILVFLAGHTGENRVTIAAHRPAPVQVNLHDLSTSGLDTMDYWMTDGHLHPADTDEGCTEALWRLDSLYLHHWPDDVPSSSPLPARERGFITFGCFASPAKLNGRVLALWARILRELPGSQILFAYRQAFADRSLRERFRTLLEGHGVARERLRFDLRRLARPEHLARVATVDIALDPFPFSGGTGTFEALAVGVPLVSLAGSRFAARCGVSHLAQVGLDRLVAANEDDYARLAVSLASDLGDLARLRDQLPSRTRASRLCDAGAYARSVEDAYRGMWLRYCGA
jgi:predicted O-linked N-acetylglucosamine transferase (SPINDLY family)